MIVALFATQSCSLFRKSEYLVITSADLVSLVGSLPDMQVRSIAQNETQRKQLIQTFKQAFSLAQAAEAEGLHKTDKYKLRLGLNNAQLLAAEYTKRNPETNISKEEAEAFYNAHKSDFDADFKMINERRKQTPTDEQKEMLRTQWSDMKARADKAKQAGLEKDPSIAIQMKFSKANLLANLYSELLEERMKPTAEEKAKYLAEHPEADVEKLKQKAQGLLDRVKKGESFEKIADEVNEDGTRGRGGDLDWFGKGRMDPDFEKVAFALEKGQLSPELVKSSFGFHIIRVDDKRTTTPKSAPPAPGAPPAPQSSEPFEEVRARHIYVNTQEAETFEQRMVQEKIKRALEDATLKYPVQVPDDFKLNVPGLDPNRVPGLGGGMGGPMSGPSPSQNK